ncbi:MAG: alpha/beta fold hydrolase [Anaerolineales bacterium]|nr:alpha/beta fold hydrolase [Anaerolineales bacterium]
MIDQTRLIFIHGLEGSSQGVKATLLRGSYPGILTPDFRGSLEERMHELYTLLEDSSGWVIIGSSFGGLMGALLACQKPQQVDKLVLLAPALIWPDFASSPPDPISVPVVLYHGRRDEIIPVESVRALAEQVFLDLDLRIVDDDHGLYKTVHAIDWAEVLQL